MAELWTAAKTGFNPGTPWESIYVVRGKPGVGKTTFAAGIPNSIVADMDPAGGCRMIVNGRAYYYPIHSWEEYLAFHALLIKDAKENGSKRKFWVVVLDPGGMFLTFCRDATMKKLNVDEIEGFDHAKVASLFRDKYLNLIANGYYLVIIDHEMDHISTLKGGVEKIVTKPLLPPSINTFLESDCHYVLTMKLAMQTQVVMNEKTKKSETLIVPSYSITTKPGKRTSLSNPKARVWLPEVIQLPNVGDASKVADHFAMEWYAAVEKMKAQLKEKI